MLQCNDLDIGKDDTRESMGKFCYLLNADGADSVVHCKDMVCMKEVQKSIAQIKSKVYGICVRNCMTY